MEYVIVGVVFFLLGVLIFATSRQKIKQAEAAAAWPGTDGVVLDARAVEKNIGSDSRSAFRHPYWIIKGRYRYQVADQSYESERLTFQDGTGESLSVINRRLESLQKGARVKVYYDPNDPSESVLFPGEYKGNYHGLVFGPLFALAGILVILAKYPGFKNLF